jgi:hypothetical protein
MVRFLFGTSVASLNNFRETIITPTVTGTPASPGVPGTRLCSIPFPPPISPIPPAPLTSITGMYKQVIQSAMKTFLSGAIATENVPGGYTEEQIVFTSSYGHIFTSAILFAFLAIALVAAQFRKGRVAFTLVNVKYVSPHKSCTH